MGNPTSTRLVMIKLFQASMEVIRVEHHQADFWAPTTHEHTYWTHTHTHTHTSELVVDGSRHTDNFRSTRPSPRLAADWEVSWLLTADRPLFPSPFPCPLICARTHTHVQFYCVCVCVCVCMCAQVCRFYWLSPLLCLMKRKEPRLSGELFQSGNWNASPASSLASWPNEWLGPPGYTPKLLEFKKANPTLDTLRLKGNGVKNRLQI